MNDIFYGIQIHKDEKTPMYVQISDEICRLIENGDILPNDKLPPIRTYAKELGINNITVVNAYKLLENKKVVYSVLGSGTYVSTFSNEEKTEYLPPSNDVKGDINISGDIINFAVGTASMDLLPVDEFKKCFDEVLTRDRGRAFGYEQSMGYEPLRTALCEYMLAYKVKSTPDKLMIISGAQQGLDIIAKALITKGDYVCTESPTYYGAEGAFLSRGAEIIRADMEHDGMELMKLTALIKQYKPKLVYTMPYFQTPTCICTSLKKKQRLIELSAKYDFYIIEEDNQCEFLYNESPVLLKALDYKNRVIYIKSFSKILMPGLRLGFMILPKPVMQKIQNIRFSTDIETSGFIQRAFELFIKSGEWSVHLEKMRSIYKSRYEIMLEASRLYLSKYLEYNEPMGGISFWYKLPKAINSDDFVRSLYDIGIAASPGTLYPSSSDSREYMRLCIADVNEQDIMQGVFGVCRRLSEWKNEAYTR